MTLPETDETQIEETTEEPGSVRSLLRERWNEIKEDKTLDLEIPRVPGDVLKVRYAALPSEELLKMVRRIEKVSKSGSATAAMAVNADFLIRCCQAILVPVSADEDAPLDVLVDDDQDPIVFDQRLAGYLGFEEEVESAREVVHRLFSKAPQPDLAIGKQAEQVIDWMQGAEGEAAGKLLDF